ncbi:HD domain-containing protein [Oryzomonas sagensis]|uniref:HD domain-containing protein n=1 Tax=Oryzomonas sagensis TaxID=2603857 RepID=A0ABQ6TMC8_9BACT|nr:DJ-1 family glyoxalase III [Oryzomonas sagensis]KAB0669602.1 HD domain-containing protein [Oryzomonas sagensis]
MPKVLIPLAEGFEELEAVTIIDVLRRAGIEVVTAGLHPGPVTSTRKVAVIPDTTIDTARVDEFDMIILPGGQPGSDNLNSDIRIDKLLKDFHAAGKLLGAICAAPIVLASAGLLNGRQATSYPAYRERLGGAYYRDKAVVNDGKFITSQGPGTALPFALAVVSRLAGNHASEDVAKAMLVSDAMDDEVWDQRLFNSTIQALVGALELKDTYTQGHAKRVTEYCLCIGSKLKLSEAKLRDLYLGAILHDIGKFGTEDDLLNKPGRLNRREETLIREHPLKGTLFIVGIEGLGHIVPTILHHHERWDGTGYPARLKGEQIPLHARIVSIADAFDAMLSVRSYRPAQEKEAAVRELQEQKGAQFDPFLVDVFIECLNEAPFEIKDFSYYF